LTPESSPGDAVNATTAAYAAGSLRDDGFNPDVEMSDLDADQRAKLATIAGRAFEGLVLVQGQYDLHESAKAWEALIKVYSDFPRNRDVSHTVQTVLSLEGLPNIRTMALHHVLTPGDVVRLRSAEATDEFRRWLWSQPDPRDAEAVGRQYLKVLSPKAHVADKSWFKVARISTITAGTTAAGAAVGTALAGPTGAVVGGAISLGASLLDAFGIEKFLRGNNPRRFAEEELRPLIAQKTLERAAEGNRRSRRAAAARARGDK
jgi:hypothetical protein